MAVGLSLAFAFGFVAMRAGLAPLTGYLLAGIVVGPFTPGYVADRGLAPQLAEIGVILLMFGVGTHFSVRQLWAVRGVALTGAITQILTATAMGAGLAHWWGWALPSGIVFGLALSVASTVVLLRALESQGALETDDGRIAVGWLVVEDLVMVVAIVLLPGIAGLFGTDTASAGEIAAVAAATLGKVGLFVAIMLVVGSRAVPWLIRQVERENSPELFTLATIALALGVAFGAAKFFGVSYALGAFVAGVVVNETDMSHRAARELRPLQDAFGALFFVAVGMLFDPRAITTHPWHLLAVVGVIVIGKSIAAAVIVRSLGRPLPTALMVAAALGQIGEFSFILGTLGVTYGFLGHDAFDLIVAGALASIALNPLLFRLVAPARRAAGGAAAVGSDGANR